MNETAAASPYGFRVTIERAGRDSFAPELHIFTRKTPRRTFAMQSASYKEGFLRLVSCEPLTREQFDRELSRVGDLSAPIPRARRVPRR